MSTKYNFNQPGYPYGGNGNAAGLDPRAYGLAQPQTWVPVVGLKGRPVATLEEARAAQIDLDGSIHVFPDFANKKIYTKAINIDGTASFNVYTLDESGQAVADASYVTHAEFEETIKKIAAEFGKMQGNQAPAAAAPTQQQVFNI